MFEPFIFINTCAVKPGRAADFEKHFQDTVELARTKEPRLLHFAAYLNDDGSEETVVQIHPDPESMILHMGVVAGHVAEAVEYLDFTGMSTQICGTPSEALLGRMRQLSGPDAEVDVKAPAGGFHRLGPAEEAPGVAEPFLFVNTYALREGEREKYRAAVRDWFTWNQAEHPRLLLHQIYLSEDGTKVTNVQLHPDAESMDSQMRLIAGRHEAWQEVVDWSTMRILVCGNPSDALSRGLQDTAGTGVPVGIKRPVGGFNRLPAL